MNLKNRWLGRYTSSGSIFPVISFDIFEKIYQKIILDLFTIGESKVLSTKLPENLLDRLPDMADLISGEDSGEDCIEPNSAKSKIIYEEEGDQTFFFLRTP